jgi:ribonuclease Z
VDKVLKDMHFAWISHVHADHHVGLPSILSKRREAFLSSGVREEDIPSLTVFGPRPLRWFLSQCEKIEPLNYRFVDCRDTLALKPMQELLLSSSSPSSFSTPFEKLVSIPVTHCAHAFGIKLEGSTNKSNVPYSIVYSGDTRPCDNMRSAAKECTLLIHEATFEDGLEHEALAKKHSTTAEALEIGSSAYLNILTHFSQRYPKVPSFNGDTGIASAKGQNAMIAFDLMRVDFKNLRRIPSLLPNVRELFEEEEDEED